MMPEIFTVDFEGVEDSCSTPVSDLRLLCAETSVYGDFRVLEVKPDTWKSLVRNTQVLGVLSSHNQDRAPKLKDLTEAFGVEHVFIGLSDLLYVFGSRR